MSEELYSLKMTKYLSDRIKRNALKVYPICRDLKEVERFLIDRIKYMDTFNDLSISYTNIGKELDFPLWQYLDFAITDLERFKENIIGIIKEIFSEDIEH